MMLLRHQHLQEGIASLKRPLRGLLALRLVRLPFEFRWNDRETDVRQPLENHSKVVHGAGDTSLTQEPRPRILSSHAVAMETRHKQQMPR